LLDRASHLRLVTHVDDKGQGVAAGLGDLLRGGEDGARQLRMRLVGFGRDDDVGAVARRAMANPIPRDAPVMNNVRPLRVMMRQRWSVALSNADDFKPAPRPRR
jgi:hypothetical protein